MSLRDWKFEGKESVGAQDTNVGDCGGLHLVGLGVFPIQIQIFQLFPQTLFFES
jgi:hypothetical protein